jgi:hypothetical protein
MRLSLSRRDFLRGLGLTGLVVSFSGGVGALLAACGDEKSAATPPPPGNQPGVPGSCERNGTVAVISDPAHQLNVSKEDLIAGTPRTYHIRGQAGHDHLVSLSESDFAALQRDQSIRVNSGLSFGGAVASHFHAVQVNCAI